MRWVSTVDENLDTNCKKKKSPSFLTCKSMHPSKKAKPMAMAGNMGMLNVDDEQQSGWGPFLQNCGQKSHALSS